jgi:hypothetical protein
MKLLDTLNRVVIVVVCLILIAALTALFLLPQIVLEGLGRWMLDWGNYFYGMDPWVRLGIGVVLAIVVDLALLLVIFFEVRRGRSRFIRVQQVAGGMANISIDSVVELLEHRLDPLPGVIEVTPRIRAKGNRVSARVEAGVNRGTNVPQTANLLIKTIQSVLTDELGLQIAGEPEVQVTVVRQRGEGADAAPPPPTTTFKPTPPPLEAPEAEAPAAEAPESDEPEPDGDDEAAS